MHLPKYAVLTDVKHETYEFQSYGPNGIIKKVVYYTEIEPGIFNLAFGDWDKTEQKIKDNTRSNNADRDKVLATVAYTTIDFIEHHPNAVLFAQGETPAKTRLYQMGIAANKKEISQLFNIMAFTAGNWEPFKEGKNYEAFALKAKENL